MTVEKRRYLHRLRTCALVFVVLTSCTTAQETPPYRLAAYIEGIGAALSITSFVVEGSVTSWNVGTSNKLTLRAAMGAGVPYPQNGYIPFELKLTYGSGSSFLEVYGGVTYLWKYNVVSDYYGGVSDSPVNIIGGIMYRHEMRRGLFFRIGYTPMYDTGFQQYRHFWGASIGILFLDT